MSHSRDGERHKKNKPSFKYMFFNKIKGMGMYNLNFYEQVCFSANVYSKTKQDNKKKDKNSLVCLSRNNCHSLSHC